MKYGRRKEDQVQPKICSSCGKEIKQAYNEEFDEESKKVELLCEICFMSVMRDLKLLRSRNETQG